MMNRQPPQAYQNAASGPSSLRSSLLPGWSEHIAPSGHLYWHNAEKGISTYHRPIGPIYTGPPPGFENYASFNLDRKIVKKEKPKIKEPIPGADGWLRVTSNHGNVFYANKETKKSQWTVPEHIRKQVESMENSRLSNEAKISSKIQNSNVEDYRHARHRRTDRIPTSVEKRKRSLEGDIKEDDQMYDKRKRKTDYEVNDKSNEDDDEDDDWQHRIAAEMVAEADADEKAVQTREKSAILKPSIEEGKNRFMEMLTKLNGTSNEINPMAPWDKELPKFVNIDDYSILEAISDRQDAFNEWCKIRLREKRAEKGAKVAVAKNDTNKSDGVKALNDPSIPYRNLLETEVKSTRTHWEDFRRNWKKDRRFFSFGRDDREREKVFREWLKELGEKKRKAAQKSENEFLQLLDHYLSDSKEARLNSNATSEEIQKIWSWLKRTKGLDSDPRYEAVGSSTMRARLFEEWAKGIRRYQPEKDVLTRESKEIMTNSNHRDTNSALRQREEEVSRKRRLIQGEKTRTLGKAMYEEDLTNFQQLLIDAIRDPLVSLADSFDDLSKDERFHSQTLSIQEKESLFYNHIDRLEERRLRLLENVFEQYAPSLDVERETALPLVLDDDEVERKQLTQIRNLTSGRKVMADFFDEWQARKEKEARKAFDEMLKENAFLDFWGRLRQEYEQRNERGENKSEEVDEQLTVEEDEDSKDTPSLLQMASTIKLDEIHSILRDDNRYRAFQHKPVLREKWIRDYLQKMELPKKSVFQR